jgi:hypothetical protein
VSESPAPVRSSDGHTVPDPLPPLVVDPLLATAWQHAVGPGVSCPVGLAGAVVRDRGAVAAVVVGPLSDDHLAAAQSALATALGVDSVEITVLPASTAPAMLRAWLYQAAGGSGRGVRVDLPTPFPQAPAPVRIGVRAIDSSARELEFRLRSRHEPALPALRALLGGREVTVVDVEGSTGPGDLRS